MSLQSQAKTRHFIVEKCLVLALFVAASVWLGIPLAKAQKADTYTLTSTHADDFEKASHTKLEPVPSYRNAQFFVLKQNKAPIGYIYSINPEPSEEEKNGEKSDCQITWLDVKSRQMKIVKTLVRQNYNRASECYGLLSIGMVSQKNNILKIGFIYDDIVLFPTLENPSADEHEPMAMTLDTQTGTWAFDEEDADTIFTLKDTTISGLKKLLHAKCNDHSCK